MVEVGIEHSKHPPVVEHNHAFRYVLMRLHALIQHN